MIEQFQKLQQALRQLQDAVFEAFHIPDLCRWLNNKLRSKP